MIRAVHGVKQTNERLFIISYESLSFLLIFLMLALEERDKNKYLSIEDFFLRRIFQSNSLACSVKSRRR